MEATIAILEDDPQRIGVMERVLRRHFSYFAHIVIHTAPAMIAWLEHHYESLALLSLDHDLGLAGLATGEDVGDGRDVANFLQNMRPVCPVIIHTSNLMGRREMEATLKAAGWQVHLIYPDPEPEWIETAWVEEIKQCLRTG